MNVRNRMFPYADYLLFLQHANEKEVAVEIIHRHLRSSSSNNATILRLWDVGCGNGDVIANLAKLVEHDTILEISLLEPNVQLLTLAQDKLKQMNAHVV